ncbi:type II secretion system protein [Paenibacillus filicis]|uniref:Type II secretion system protein n=1 Tax=Paenibacillus filicis TaxID=669464 RepID=A0ABU9DIA9_9BACL
MLRNEKGLTLVEILASLVILSMVILAFTYTYNQLFSASAREQKRDVSVDIARSVMEQLKASFSSGTASMNIWFPPTNNSGTLPNPGADIQQLVNLVPLRQTVTSPVQLETIYYPSASDRQYKVNISNIPIPEADKQVYTITDNNRTSYTLKVADHFSLIQVEIIPAAGGVSYAIQSYLDRNS